MLRHAYSLPQITMETLSVEAGLDAMVLTYGGRHIEMRCRDGVFSLMSSQSNVRYRTCPCSDSFRYKLIQVSNTAFSNIAI